MLFLICLLCALLSTGTSDSTEKKAVTFAPEVTAVIRAAIQKCMVETGVSPNAVGLVSEGKYMEDDTYKKYVYCVFQESGFAKPDGHVIISKVVDVFPKELNILPIIENCDKQGKDPVETSFLYFKCFQDTSPVRMAV